MKSSNRRWKSVCVGLVALALAFLVPEMVSAEERMVGTEELNNLIVGKRIVDTERSDHWVSFAQDGTAVGGSRGRKFDMTYRITDGGWCREIKPKGGSSGDKSRYKKCQDTKYDGTHLYFYDKDGTLASKFAIE